MSVYVWAESHDGAIQNQDKARATGCGKRRRDRIDQERGKEPVLLGKLKTGRWPAKKSPGSSKRRPSRKQAGGDAGRCWSTMQNHKPPGNNPWNRCNARAARETDISNNTLFSHSVRRLLVAINQQIDHPSQVVLDAKKRNGYARSPLHPRNPTVGLPMLGSIPSQPSRPPTAWMYWFGSFVVLYGALLYVYPHALAAGHDRQGPDDTPVTGRVRGGPTIDVPPIVDAMWRS